jgi:photosystem II stability/assembly factor-like uncharacterized protein
MRWRMIGPFRAGRTVALDGIPSQPNVFYIGVNNGGVWKTSDAGRTWKPIFDDQPTGSIGALAVAPSDPNIIYVGSGEGLQRPDLSTGDGMYKSTDGGATWKHIGLREGQQIGAVLVDPKDPNRVFVAVLGHPYGPNPERGVYRTLDGGATWTKVLYKDVDTGAIALSFDPRTPRTVWAALWAGRQGPWENGAWNGPNSGLFKSTDGGDTWTPITKGLPTTQQGLSRIGFAIAPSDPRKMYAIVDAGRMTGVYRSVDAGESWERTNSEARVTGRGTDFAEVKVHPTNPETIFVANTSTYRSTDGGKTFTAIKGAPGGDDYHTIWINPKNPDIIALALDQGATISVNGGETWSSWYNQPTAQFYHVSTDNQWPYWVMGGQQESGSAAVLSRGDNGAISFRDWRTIGVEEYGYAVADPLNPNYIYGGKLTRFDRRTGQVQDIAPAGAGRGGPFRTLRTAPVVFSPVDPHILLYGASVVFKTTTGGNSWQRISPDLSREKTDIPESIGIYRTPEMATQPRRGVIYTLAPSYKDVNVIWAGTDDGLIHVTLDGGKTWKNVTPPELTAWSKVSVIDAGRFDPATAYAAINRIRLDDLKPHIYRTHDSGKTWTEVVRGLPLGPINVVREDPVRKGLLYAGSETSAFVSFNDGDDWQSLRLNMPATSVRDLVVHEDDLVAGTHGRAFWILDDVTPLRQMAAKVAEADAFLFKPATAIRARRNVNTDTPLPPEEPVGQNPPDGAILDYVLKSAATGPVKLEILDAAGKLVRVYSSEDQPEPLDPELNVPTYWIRPFHALATSEGMHRFVWDLHYAPPAGSRPEFPISAIYHDTPRGPLGPAALPGVYAAKLTVNGKTLSQTFTVKMDPRVKTPPTGIAEQHRLSMLVYEMIAKNYAAIEEAGRLRVKASGKAELEQKIAAVAGATGGGRRGRGGASDGQTLAQLDGELEALLGVLEGADAAPTTQAVAAVSEAKVKFDKLMLRWESVRREIGGN